MSPKSRPTLSDIPPEMQIMIAEQLPSRLIFPRIVSGPTFGSYRPSSCNLALTSKRMDHAVSQARFHNDKSILLATGLDSPSSAPDAHREFWDRIKDGTVKHLVFATGTGGWQTDRCEGFMMDHRFLQSLAEFAPDHKITTITYDERIMNEAQFRQSGSSYLRIPEVISAGEHVLRSRTDGLPTALRIQTRRDSGRGCSFYCPGSRYNGRPVSITYQTWGDMSFGSPGSPNWDSRSLAYPPRFNYNVANVSPEVLFRKFKRHCEMRNAVMGIHAETAAGRTLFTEIVNLYADPCEDGMAKTTSAHADPNTITTNEQLKQLERQLTEIVRQAGLSGDYGHPLVVNLGVCDARPYSVGEGLPVA